MTDEATATSPVRQDWLFPALVFSLAASIYGPALAGDYVWDDQILMRRDLVAELRGLGVYLREPFTVAGPDSTAVGYYRPLPLLSLALGVALHGGNAVGFHLLNLVLHGINSVLVYRLSRHLSASPIAALAGALVFAWFPRNSEAVAWISGVTDILATTFTLSAVLLAQAQTRCRHLAPGLVLLALLSKESGIAALVALGTIQWRSTHKAPLKSRIRSLVPLTAVGAAYGSLRISALGFGSARESLATDLPATARLATFLEAIGRNAAMLVNGWTPRLQSGVVGAPAWGFVALGILILGLLVLAVRRCRPSPHEAPILLLSATSLAVVLHVIPIDLRVVAADRFLYLPVAGLCVVVATRLNYLLPKHGHTILLLVAASYAPVTWGRASIWGNNVEFWGTAVAEQTPQYNALAQLGFGNILASHGLYPEAIAVYRRALPGDERNYIKARHNEASLLAMNGELDAATAVLQSLATLAPNAQLFRQLAVLHTVNGRPAEANTATNLFLELDETTYDRQDFERQLEKTRELLTAAQTPGEAPEQHRARAQALEGLGMHRLATAARVRSAQSPDVTPGQLRRTLMLTLEHGTNEELAAIFDRLADIDPRGSAAFSPLLVERREQVRRLRELCRELRMVNGETPTHVP